MIPELRLARRRVVRIKHIRTGTVTRLSRVTDEISAILTDRKSSCQADRVLSKDSASCITLYALSPAERCGIRGMLGAQYGLDEKPSPELCVVAIFTSARATFVSWCVVRFAVSGPGLPDQLILRAEVGAALRAGLTAFVLSCFRVRSCGALRMPGGRGGSESRPYGAAQGAVPSAWPSRSRSRW